MRFKKVCVMSLTLITLALVSCSTNKQNYVHYAPLTMDITYSKARTLNNFNDYVQFLKQKAAGAGVSEQLLNQQGLINYNARAVQLDQEQAARKRDPNMSPPPANPNGVTNYLNKVLTKTKVNMAVKRWYDYNLPLTKASQKYGVRKEYLLALWGM